MATATCTGGTVTCWIVSKAQILTNIANTLGPVERLITGSSYIIGAAFLFKALHSLKMYGEMRTMGSSSTSMKEPIVYFVIGAMLIYFPSAVSLLMNTTFGYSSILQYAPVDSSNQTMNTLFGSGSLVGKPLTMIIQVVGLIAFIRGWVLIARSASQGQPPGGTGKGLIHVFGGILAINIVGTLNIVNNTLFGSS